MSRIKVLIVDDSAVMRQLLVRILESAGDVEVVGTAPDPYVAYEKIKALEPHVVTLDVEMPRMDGLTFLERLMKLRPTPVIMVSSLTESGCDTTLRALELGAVDFIAKPKIDVSSGTLDLADVIIEKVRSAARAKLRKASAKPPQPAVQRPVNSRAMLQTTDKVVAIGASTGGTEAIREVLERLPADAPPIVIVQHMPPGFTRAFANRLNSIVSVQVKEAENGDRVFRGRVLIAPGDHHMVLTRSGAEYGVRIFSGERVNHHRPSVDVLFDSCAEIGGTNVIGVLLTGMGNDGARGLHKMKAAGAHTIAQNEETCVVFGMPHEAIELGAAQKVLPLGSIAQAILHD